MGKLDSKDYQILRELDQNYRIPFSKIAKKINLSKSSVILRFKKLQPYITHSTVGINHELLGYKLIKIFYTFDLYDEHIEKRIISELKKHKNILWAARFYGSFDVSISLLVNNFNSFISHITKFNETFAKEITNKEIQIISKQFFFRHDYLYKNPTKYYSKILPTSIQYNLSKSQKKILSELRKNPRISILDLSKKTNLSPKTTSTQIKELEKKKIITGYFPTFNNEKFNLNTFKLLIQIKKPHFQKQFENYFFENKNVRHFRKMLGLWDYEIDLVYPTMKDLQIQIEILKQKFPGIIKKISIVSFGKRIITNKESFLE